MSQRLFKKGKSQNQDYISGFALVRDLLAGLPGGRPCQSPKIFTTAVHKAGDPHARQQPVFLHERLPPQAAGQQGEHGQPEPESFDEVVHFGANAHCILAVLARMPYDKSYNNSGPARYLMVSGLIFSNPPKNRKKPGSNPILVFLLKYLRHATDRSALSIYPPLCRQCFRPRRKYGL